MARAVVMIGTAEQEVLFDGATAPLHGRAGKPAGTPWGSLVLAHGRNEDMDGRLVAALARRGPDLGLWTLRFNFAFRESATEPSAGHADEIEDLRAAIVYARSASATELVYVAGRGLGAWATVAAATDEVAAGTILLGLAYEGQRERQMALLRLAEFEIPTLILVGFESDRLDLPKLESIVASSPSLNLEVLSGADHRLQDARGRVLIEPVMMKAEAWLRLRREERT